MTAVTDRAREKGSFISILAEACNVSEACRGAGISRQTAYRWREEDPEFAAEWKDAEESAADKLEKTAWDRATTEKSDRMLEILLKAHRPEKFVDKQRVEHSGRTVHVIELVAVESSHGDGTG